MKPLTNKKLLLMALASTGLIFLFISSSPRMRVDYITQVKPIFNKRCIVCHGGVRRNGDFSLLFRSDALAPVKSGKRAIIPGDPEHSELIARITHKDPDERMPKGKAPLSQEEIDLLRRWIKAGAEWGDHWAYVPVKEVAVPKPSTFFLAGLRKDEAAQWAKNDLDFFVHDQLKKEKLAPAPAADKATLLRRASLDLIGVPAPTSIATSFMRDSSTTAYENLVDSLLASPRFGERWASMWLDLA